MGDPLHVTNRSIEATNPAHYRQPGRRESIDEMRDELTEEEFVGFCKGNAMKYRYRAGLKEGQAADRDMAKAHWYEQMGLHVLYPSKFPDPRAKLLDVLEEETDDRS